MSISHPLARRAVLSERLDQPGLDAALLRANLAELALLNRLPGGVGASLSAIRALVPPAARDRLVVLDAGTGGADIPRAFLRAARRSGADWQVVGVERRSEVLVAARAASGADPRLTLVEGDAGRLALDDDSVDVAHASLLLHHLDPDDAVTLLTELRRVARLGVVVNDLRRGLLPFLLTACAVLAIGRSAYTRHDGIVSARRAYDLAELRELLDAAGLRPIWSSPRLLPRVAIAAVPVERP